MLYFTCVLAQKIIPYFSRHYLIRHTRTCYDVLDTIYFLLAFHRVSLDIKALMVIRYVPTLQTSFFFNSRVLLGVRSMMQISLS